MDMISLKKNKQPVLAGNIHHIGARESQQDSFGISDISNAELCERKGVFGVAADGMGGMADGADISVIAVRSMLQYFSEIETSGNSELDLLNMLFVAENNVNSFLAEFGRGRGGTTIAAVIIKDNALYWVSVGDSRICLMRGGALIQLNREHTYGAELDEKAARGELSWEDAAYDHERASLTSYLGNGRLEKLDRNTRPVKLLNGDRVLLMTDGVFGILKDDEITEAMAHKEPQKCAEILQYKIQEKRHPNQDNFTAVIFENI